MTGKDFQRGLKTLKSIFGKGSLPPPLPPIGALPPDPTMGLRDSQPELMPHKILWRWAIIKIPDIKGKENDQR